MLELAAFNLSAIRIDMTKDSFRESTGG
jgi:hypothetical protein